MFSRNYPKSLPVNFWPILLPIILIYFGCMWLLYRKAPKAAAVMLGITLLCITAVYLNTNVETKRTRNMSWKVYDSTLGSTSVELSDSQGDQFTTYFASPSLAEYLKNTGKQVVAVELIEWRDFGRLRAYRVRKIDDIDISTWTGAASLGGR